MAIYALQAAGCAAHLALLQPWLHALSLAAAALVAWAGVTSWRNSRALDTTPGNGAAQAMGSRGCMAQSGVFVSAIFLLLIVVGDIPAFVLKPC